MPDAVVPEAAEAGGEAEDALPTRPGPPPPRTGRWFQNEAASDVFADQLRQDDPKLKSLCLVPPKCFAEDDVEKICTGLEVNNHCRELLASGHSLSEVGCRRLAQMLRTNGSLQLLSLGDSTLGDRACLLFEGLAENLSLTSLDLEHKGLTATAGKALAQALKRRAELGAARLETLQLSRNGALGAAFADLAEAPAPRELLLCDASLDEDRAAAVGRWAARGVEEINLRDNNSLGCDGLEQLLEALLPSRGSREAPALRKLRLDGCAVGDDGLEALAAALARGLELEELSLERCELTASGCEHLVRALRGRRLQALSVRANVLGDASCELLAACSERLDLGACNLSPSSLAWLGEQPLVSLELFSNPLLGPSAAGWCNELKREHWQQLEQLDMSACALGNEGFRYICSALVDRPQLMPKLTSLCLGGNEVEDTDEFNDLAEKLGEARAGRLRMIWKNT